MNSNTNHFVSFVELLNHISNFKHLDMHTLYYDEIASCAGRAYIGSLFMGHENDEIIQRNLKETLIGNDYIGQL